MLIFVFGSNLAGRHGRGSALAAARLWGARQGIGEGPTGHAYAIPTKDRYLMTRTLDEVRASVETFKTYARTHPADTFRVCKIGCGLAGFSESDIAPMFLDAPINCDLPPGWRSE